MTPQSLTAEEIRKRLFAGESLWLRDGSQARHLILSVEDLTADHVLHGERFKIVFRGYVTGRTLALHARESTTFPVEIGETPSPQEDT